MLLDALRGMASTGVDNLFSAVILDALGKMVLTGVVNLLSAVLLDNAFWGMVLELFVSGNLKKYIYIRMRESFPIIISFVNF